MNIKQVFKRTRTACGFGLMTCFVGFGANFFIEPSYAQTTAPAPSPKPTVTAPVPASPTSNSTVFTGKVRGSEAAVDANVPEDPAVMTILAPFRAKVDLLNAPIGKLESDIQKRGLGGGTIGNFVSDAMRSQATARTGKPVILAITNSGGLRKNKITAGDLRTSDIYELLPFENALVTVDFTGEQLRRLLGVIIAGRDVQSGAVITYRTNAERKLELADVEFVSAAKSGGDKKASRRIEPNAVYTIVTTDYLVNRGGDYAIFKEGKNLRPLGVTMRDAVLAYVQAETAAKRKIDARLDRRFRRAPNANNDTDRDGEN